MTSLAGAGRRRHPHPHQRAAPPLADTAASGHADDLSSARDTYRMWPARFAVFLHSASSRQQKGLARGLA